MALGRDDCVSVEDTQQWLTDKVFQHTKSPRKASGRAMGTLVEIITYYLIREWGFGDDLSIETALPEYGERSITHNVEYSVHPIIKKYVVEIPNASISAGSVIRALQQQHGVTVDNPSNGTILSSDGIMKNGRLLNKDAKTRFVANVVDRHTVTVIIQRETPYMIFECKRVGRDAKNNRGPQAIEKAKQGSYVAKTVSSLQKIRDRYGKLQGVIYDNNNKPIIKPYNQMISELINSVDSEHLKNFILTVGVVSNHGNWFTDKNQNKEMKVLAESYDWLLFLTDDGLTEFINNTVLNKSKYPATYNAFTTSYAENKSGNRFTKVNMIYDAHVELARYFKTNRTRIESWFNVITPHDTNVSVLIEHLTKLQKKEWVN